MREYRPKSPAEIYRNMSAIRSKDNKTELLLRHVLHRMGFRFRKHDPSLPGKPDIVFRREKVAVFIDGDYWHGRVLLDHGEKALRERIRKNREYWIPKIQNTINRDARNTAALKAEGWLVLRFWESDARKSIPETAQAIAEIVRARRSPAHGVR